MATPAMLEALPLIRMPAGGRIPCFNGLSPLIACLDPQRRFPILNERTETLLQAMGLEQDANGAAGLLDIIGRGRYNIHDSFELDVYANTHSAHIRRAARRVKRLSAASPRPVAPLRLLGQKSEEISVAQLAKTRLRIRRSHNELTNRFEKAVRYRHVLRESALDILIQGWRGGRWLIIEAKTSTSGPAGRMQLRQAIGQLFDYRFTYFRTTKRPIDLALLTPGKPTADVLALLRSLKVYALWFDGDRLRGQIQLIP